MKFSKLIIGCMGILMASSLCASQDESEPTFSLEQYKYIGYEAGTTVGSLPVLGYRCQYKSYIADFNAGYKYMETYASSTHYWKAGISAYKKITSSENGQFYIGVGAEAEEIRLKVKDEKKKVLKIIHPSVSVGRDFPIGDDKKVFAELSYRPYAFYKGNTYQDHSMGLRMGVGY